MTTAQKNTFHDLTQTYNYMQGMRYLENIGGVVVVTGYSPLDGLYYLWAIGKGGKLHNNGTAYAMFFRPPRGIKHIF